MRSDRKISPRAIIRPAGVGDIPVIEALAGVIWRAVYPAILTSEQIEYMLSWMYSPGQLAADLAAGIVYELLEVEGETAGFAAYGPGEGAGVCKLHKLYLHPGHHGKGLGSRLLGHVIAAVGGRGYTSLTLNVNKNNARAIAVYRRHGFRVVEEVVNPIGRGFVMDDYVMDLPLADRRGSGRRGAQNKTRTGA